MDSLRKFIQNTLEEAHYTTWKKLGELGPLQHGENLEEAPVDSFQGQEYEIAQKLTKHFNIGKFAPLGNGTNGFAYYIPNNKVLKITKDKSEVAEAKKIQGKKLKHLADIYGTYSLGGKYEGTYVVILELLNRSEDIDTADVLLSEVMDKEYGYDIVWMFEDYSNGSVPKEDIKEYRQKVKEYFFDEKKAKLALWYLDGMIGIIDEIRKNGIKSTDWVLPNLGIKRNGNLAMYDLGFGDPNIPDSVQNINLNQEGANVIVQKSAGMEFPDFFDGQANPLFNARAYPPVQNANDKPLAETEISQEDINKKELPYKFYNLFDDFVGEVTELEIREIAPTIDLSQPPALLMKNLETNYPALFDNFAEWIFNKKKNDTTIA